MWTRAQILAGIGAVAGLLVAAPAANAAFGLTNLSATPASSSAGANTDFTIDLTIQEPSHDLKDLTIHLPPGLVGNPLATPQCTEARLNSAATGGAGCPAASQVGTVSNSVVITVGVSDSPQTVTGKIYNVTPRPGEPGRFGIVLQALPLSPPLSGLVLPPIVLQSPARLRQSDFGLDTVLSDLPRRAEVALGVTAEIDITRIALALEGMAGNPPQGFIRLPTSCGAHTVGFDAAAYDGQTATGQASFTTDNCGALPFSPELTARAKPQGIGKAMEFSTTIAQTIEEAGLAHAQVILPNGITGNNDLLGTTCPRPDFEAGNCPANTIIGNASASSPLQSQSLTGTVALVQPLTPGFPDVGLDLRGALSLKLTGSLALEPGGRAVTTFAGLPDIPISDFTLAFTPTPGFVFAGVDLCRVPPLFVDGVFRAFSGAETAVKAPIKLQGCAGGGGSGHGRKPRAKIKIAKQGTAHPRMKLRIRAGSEKLRQASLELPRELAFSGGKSFERGSTVKAGGKKLADKAVEHTKRGLKLKAKRAVGSFVGKFSGHALRADDELKPHDRLRFKLKVRDRTGATTKLTVRTN